MVKPSPQHSLIRLRTIKLVHTLIWAFFVSCIVAIPILAWSDRYLHAAVVSGVVLLECAVLLLNGWRCPLTDMAAPYTTDRRDNFDIYLPQWLARHNKLIFGLLYAAGMAYAAIRWALAR